MDGWVDGREEKQMNSVTSGVTSSSLNLASVPEVSVLKLIPGGSEQEEKYLRTMWL